MPRARTVAAWALLAVAAGPPAALARTFVVYDDAASAAALAAPGDDGRPVGAAGGWLQQLPARVPVLGPDRQAEKVSGGAGSAATPSLRGRAAAGVAALLQARIRASGAHVVFLDELGPAFRGPGGAPLADALALLDHPSPWGGTWARRVHLYVPTLPELIAAPSRWAPAWAALARAGGVWFQTYRGDLSPWRAAEWAVWPAAFAHRLREAGGDPARLHPVISRGDQDAIWDAALTGPACALTANGVGVFRVGPSLAAFRRRLVAAFGPDGTGTPACRFPVEDDARTAALAGLAGMSATGGAVPPGAVSPTRVRVGLRTRVVVALGADPLGIAAGLGRAPGDLLRAAAPQVWALAPGHTSSARLRPDGTAAVTVAPTAPGPVRLELRLRADALGPPADHGWLDRLVAAEAAPGQIAAAIRFPRTWRLRIPIGVLADPAAGVSAVRRLARVATVRLELLPGRPAPRRRSVVATLVRADGTAGAHAPVVVRTGRGRPYRRVSDARGTVRLTSAAGRLSVRAVSGGARAALAVPR